MRTIEQIRNARLSMDELDEEIQARRKLLCDMVGTLYPGIVYDEIAEIRRRRDGVQNLF